ncbi:DUF262 domain-containing protein [Sphingomonas sp. S6]|uniref:DUF262 domain-containing protein n=1 Tax=Sphingomonas sp. S6 TaxID=3368600 RepID=UPI0028E3B167|nr:DUF262 domain-containing protein [uncultured Sphingomonas sp.]
MVTQADQLDLQKRTVSYDMYDMSVRQLIDMVESGVVDIAPDYQRHFVWDDQRESELIESIFLGIPVPSLYMATNSDATWEVVDGVQRLSTLIHFCGSDDARRRIERPKKLELNGLRKLDSFNGANFDNLPRSIQLTFTLRPLRVTTLNDKSDKHVRYDLFERLNTGGVKLHAQEIRNCVLGGRFRDIIKELASDENFRSVVALPNNEIREATYEEMILRFFAFYQSYLDFDHDVESFLTSYMENHARTGPPDEATAVFLQTMEKLKEALPNGISRNNRKTTPINLYEGVAVGAALAIATARPLDWSKLQAITEGEPIKKFTTAATNSRPMVRGRIEMVRDGLFAQ